MSKSTLFDPEVTTTSSAIVVAPPPLRQRTTMVDPAVHVASGGSITAETEVIGGN